MCFMKNMNTVSAEKDKIMKQTVFGGNKLKYIWHWVLKHAKCSYCLIICNNSVGMSLCSCLKYTMFAGQRW